MYVYLSNIVCIPTTYSVIVLAEPAYLNSIYYTYPNMSAFQSSVHHTSYSAEYAALNTQNNAWRALTVDFTKNWLQVCVKNSLNTYL